MTPWTDYVLSVETFKIIFEPDIVLTTVQEELTQVALAFTDIGSNILSPWKVRPGIR